MEACFIEGGCEFFFQHLMHWKIVCGLLSHPWIHAALSKCKKIKSRSDGEHNRQWSSVSLNKNM